MTIRPLAGPGPGVYPAGLAQPSTLQTLTAKPVPVTRALITRTAPASSAAATPLGQTR